MTLVNIFENRRNLCYSNFTVEMHRQKILTYKKPTLNGTGIRFIKRKKNLIKPVLTEGQKKQNFEPSVKSQKAVLGSSWLNLSYKRRPLMKHELSFTMNSCANNSKTSFECCAIQRDRSSVLYFYQLV